MKGKKEIMYEKERTKKERRVSTKKKRKKERRYEK